eukprot:Hpha_TRINITY_DN16099_c0_g3::TRINITY_DN16099_c0_g3_i1::g.118964::m.118964
MPDQEQHILLAKSSAEWGPEILLDVTPPDTASNFLDFNKPAEDLNSDWLMQPVNEADYDSETQYCVDVKERGESASYYSHFVTKRKKKKRGKKEEKPHVVHRPHLPVEHLAVPGGAGLPKGLLSSAAVRRIACGAMPPRPASPPSTVPVVCAGPAAADTAPPSYSPRTRFSSKPPSPQPSPKAAACDAHRDPCATGDVVEQGAEP